MACNLINSVDIKLYLSKNAGTWQIIDEIC